jgi:NitT/TauT family transport system substrate-binding protein
VALLALSAAIGCGARSEPGERLVVAAVRQPATALFFVAQDAGCFDRERLEIVEHTFELGRDAVALLRADEADLAIAYQTPTLRAAFADERIRVLTTLHTSTRNTRVVARRDRGIAGFPGLAGARIGLARGSNADFLVDLVLRFGGVPRSRTEISNLTPEASVAALARGELDAAVLSDPYAAQAERVLGDGGRTLQTDLYTEVSLLLTRDGVLRTREAALRRLVRGLVCAERAARERPEESLARIRARFPDLAEGELRAQLERVRWRLGLDHVLAGVLRDEAEWLRGTGAVQGEPPDLERLLSRRPLEDVAPDAVMLLSAKRVVP